MDNSTHFHPPAPSGSVSGKFESSGEDWQFSKVMKLHSVMKSSVGKEWFKVKANVLNIFL